MELTMHNNDNPAPFRLVADASDIVDAIAELRLQLQRHDLPVALERLVDDLLTDATEFANRAQEHAAALIAVGLQ